MVINPAASTAHEVSDSLALRAWRDVHASSDVEAPAVDFDVAYEQSLVDGARAVQRAIQTFRHGALIALLSSCCNCAHGTWLLWHNSGVRRFWHQRCKRL